jgi:hypothetical protein
LIVILKPPPGLGREALVLANYDLPRDCPRCSRAGCHGSVVGHGRRKRTSLDEDLSEIRIRRGRCRACGGTITFLPPSLQPYRRYAVPVIASVVKQRLRAVSYSALKLVLYNPDIFPDLSTVQED